MSHNFSDRRQFLVKGSQLCFAAAFGFAAALTRPSSALAADALDFYRANGTIAERFDGYLQLRDANAPSDARKLVAEVNAKRRELYEKRAAEQSVPVSAVGEIYAAQIFRSAPAGTYFLQAGGGYIRK